MFIDMGLAKAVGLGLVVIGGIVVAVKAAKQGKITWHAADIFALVVIVIGFLLVMGLVKTDSASTATDRLRTNMREHIPEHHREELPALKETSTPSFDEQMESLNKKADERIKQAQDKIIN